MSENWDNDPDFELPTSLPVASTGGELISASSENEAHSGRRGSASASSGAGSALFSSHSATSDSAWGDDDDEEDHDYGQVLQPHQRTIELVTFKDPFERSEVTDSAQLAPRSKEEEEQSSTDSSRNSTIRGLLNSFSGLSLDSPTLPADPFEERDDAQQPSPTEATTPRAPRSADPSSRSLSSMTTIRNGSHLSKLITSASTGPGRVHHLGSAPRGSAQSVLGDWDEDLEGLDALSNDLTERSLRVMSSFTSHISDDPDDERLGRGLPTPRTTRKTSAISSTGSQQSMRSAFSEDDDANDVESDFELPRDLGRFTLSPLLGHSRANSIQAQTLLTSAFPPATPSPNSMLMPGLVRGGETTSEEDGSDDESFFEDLVIPSYFLGGPGQLTPPSDGEKGHKVDLQAVLKRKLEARGGRGLDDTRSATITAKGKTQPSRLDSYREDDVEDGGAAESGLVISDDVKLGAERMRTRSAPRPPALLKTRKAAQHSSAHGRPPLPRATTPSAAGPRPPSVQGKLARTGSAGAFPNATQPSTSVKPSYVSPGRPASAAGTIERPHRERRPGPPPAPSAALRDRVRTRTVSLRPSVSSSLMSTKMALRIDTSRDDRMRPSLSPMPLTPATPSIATSGPSPARPASAARTLHSKRSQSNLLVTPSRTIERKRSLQDFAAPSPTSARRPGPSPTPGYASPVVLQPTPRRPNPTSTTPSTSSSRFAQPTAASSSRIRERVLSGPTLPFYPSDRTPLASPALPSSPFVSRPPLTISRPSSAASMTRLTQPTVASRAKARPLAPPSPALSGARSPLNLAAFQKGPQRHYGDGTELDAFDDLPTNKERERSKAPSRSGTTRARTTSQYVNKAAPTSKMTMTGAAKRSAADEGETKEVKLERDSLVKSKKGKDGKRREPQLIRNMGAHSVAKIHGEMTWNPMLQRWEGNEGVLKEFDRVLSTSTRPALITQLSSSTSPGRIAFPSSTPTSASPNLATTPAPTTNLSGANVKVVGSMVFDPIRMSWHSIAGPDDEDELDLFGDDEHEIDDGWEKGERERMLKNRASFVLSDRTSTMEEDERVTRLRAESREAVRRHREEMKGWTMRKGREERIEKDWLFDLRNLILDTASTTT